MVEIETKPVVFNIADIQRSTRMSLKNRTENERGPAEAHPYDLGRAMARFERGYLSNILELTRWNRAKAASMLGIEIETLEMKIRFYQLSPGNPLSAKTED